MLFYHSVFECFIKSNRMKIYVENHIIIFRIFLMMSSLSCGPTFWPINKIEE